LNEGEQLIRTHLDPLPEVIGDHDPPVLGRRVIDEQFRTPAAAIPAQYGNPGKARGVVHLLFPPSIGTYSHAHTTGRERSISWDVKFLEYPPDRRDAQSPQQRDAQSPQQYEYPWPV
jgi:hypothetical protein